jgi:drug/metabolite transporter (DMT)-like permease
VSRRRPGLAARCAGILGALSAIDLALVLASALLHAVWSVSIKQSRDPLAFNWLQCGFSLALLSVSAPWVPWASLPIGVWGLLALTGPTHALYLYWMGHAFERGDLSLVYPIARSTPAFLPLIAVPLFGESLHPLGAAGIAVVVGGMWLVHLPRAGAVSGPAAHADFAGSAARFAYLTLAATIAYSLFDKAAMAKLAASAWPSPLPRALAYSFLLYLAHALAFTPLVLRARGGAALRDVARGDLVRAAGAGAMSVVGYALILRALETSLVSYVVAVRQSSVLFTVALSALWLRERPGRPRVIGACATVLGVGLIAWFG